MRLFSDLANILFPRLCPVCGKPLVEGEELMCVNCLLDLPRLPYCPNATPSPLDHALMLSPRLERAATLFRYRRNSPYARLIHKAKYGGRPRVGRLLGELFASETLPTGFFSGIDAILPVPLHWTKRLRRGYNQSEAIADGVSAVTGIPVWYNLVARRSHATQTHKSDAERQAGVAGVFDVVHPEDLRGTHLLLLDDVITTGATIRECASTLRLKVDAAAQPSLRLSAASIAFARSR